LAALVFLWLSEKRGLVFFGLVAVAVILPFTAPKTLTKRVSQTFTQRADRRQITVAGTRLDMSTSARLMQMQNVLRDFTQHPVLGFGVTGYKFVDAQYFKVLIETGLIGLFIFFLLLLSIFRLTYRVFKEASEPVEKGLSMGFIAGFIGLLAHAVGTNTFIIVRIMEPFWFVLAIVVMMPNLESETPEGKDAESIAHGKKRMR